MTLIAPWIMVTGTVGMQWAQATGIIVAQLLGQKRSEPVFDRFLLSAWRGALVASGIVSALLLAVCLSAGILYADLNKETRVVLLGFLPVLLVLPFPKGSNAICGNTLRASGDTIYVMHIFVCYTPCGLSVRFSALRRNFPSPICPRHCPLCSSSM